MAANSIHYINKTISEMDEYGTADYLFTNHAKYWSELRFCSSFNSTLVVD